MLTLQFVPYSEIEKLDAEERVAKIIDLVKEDKIVLMQGRLHPEEEALLIERTMSQIEEAFKGIELCTIYPEEKDLPVFGRFKKEMIKRIIGNRDGVTIVGPASVVKEIKRDLNNIQLFMRKPGYGGVIRRSSKSSRRSSRSSRRSSRTKSTRTKRRRR